MKIHISELKPDLDLNIEGGEDWLAPIYADFPLPEDCQESAARIGGSAKVTKISDDFIQVSGQLNFAPWVNCSRCVKPIAWPISESFEIYYQRREPTELPKDQTLRKGELDEYYFSGQEIDIGVVINDVIQTAVPIRYLVPTEDGSSCKVCGIDLEAKQVFGQPSGEDDEDNPFAVLKNVKTKH